MTRRPPPPQTGGRQYLTYRFPFGDFSAELILPRDLTAHEAERLSKFIHSLVVPDAPDAGTGG